MADLECRSAGEILGPWLKQMDQRRELMEQEGQMGGALPAMGNGMPIPEENMTRVVGRLVKQPLVRVVSGGTKMASFMLKVPRSYHTADRKATEDAYVPILAWRSHAERAESLGQGSAVSIEGYLRTWANPEGKGFRWQVVAETFEVLEHRKPVKDTGRGAAKEAAVATA